MKKGILFIAILCVFALVSCETENTDRPMMTANVGGDAFICTEPYAIIGDSTFLLAGTSSDGLTIEFVLGGSSVGGYNMNDIQKNIGIYVPNKSENAYRYSSHKQSPEGIAYIDEIDKENMEVSGTFFFKVWHPVDPLYEYISDGKFKNVPFTYLESK